MARIAFASVTACGSLPGMRVAGLWVYPVKGLRGIEVATVEVEARGLAFDRRWLVVDAAGKFLSQRSHPKMATVAVRLTPGGLQLSVTGVGEVAVPLPSGAERRPVVVWRDTVDAAVACPEAADFLSTVLGAQVALVHQDDARSRLRSGPRLPSPTPVSFADGYPILVTQTASLAALNDELVAHGEQPVPMDRFRPNVVLKGDASAWAEDGWHELKVGEAVVLEVKSPCVRCVVTTTDQQTGRRHGPEPLATLARLRRPTAPGSEDGVTFGINAVPRALGTLRVGDTVQVVPG